MPIFTYISIKNVAKTPSKLDIARRKLTHLHNTLVYITSRVFTTPYRVLNKLVVLSLFYYHQFSGVSVLFFFRVLFFR